MGSNTYEIPANMADEEPIADFMGEIEGHQEPNGFNWDDADFDYANSFISKKSSNDNIETYDQI
jgi:hypothetical protein